MTDFCGLDNRISQLVSDLTKKGMYHVAKKLDKLIDIKLGAFGQSHVQRQESFEAKISAKVNEVRAALKELQIKGNNDTFMTSAETTMDQRLKCSSGSGIMASPNSWLKKPGTKVV